LLIADGAHTAVLFEMANGSAWLVARGAFALRPIRCVRCTHGPCPRWLLGTDQKISA